MGCHNRIASGLSIRSTTRPSIVSRTPHHVCPYRIQLDTVAAGQNIIFILRQTRLEPTFPQRTTTPVRSIDVLHITPPKILHHQCGTVGSSWRNQQMHMIGHQHIGMYFTTVFISLILQRFQIAVIVFFRIKARAAIVAALNDVPCNPSHSQPCPPWHCETPFQLINCGLPPVVLGPPPTSTLALDCTDQK